MGARGANSRNGKAIESAVVADSIEAAEEAGLQYVNDDRPGYSRKAKGKDFEYFDTDGKAIRDEQRVLLHIRGAQETRKTGERRTAKGDQALTVFPDEVFARLVECVEKCHASETTARPDCSRQPSRHSRPRRRHRDDAQRW